MLAPRASSKQTRQHKGILARKEMYMSELKMMIYHSPFSNLYKHMAEQSSNW